MNVYVVTEVLEGEATVYGIFSKYKDAEELEQNLLDEDDDRAITIHSCVLED